jgi:hypothetical protein
MPAAASKTTSSSPREPAPLKAGGGAVTVERDAGKKVAAAFKGVKAAIHRRHGIDSALPPARPTASPVASSRSLGRRLSQVRAAGVAIGRTWPY